MKIKFAKILALHANKYDCHLKYVIYTSIIHHVFEVLKKTPEKIDNLLRSNYLRVGFFLDFGQILVRFMVKVGQIVSPILTNFGQI